MQLSVNRLEKSRIRLG